MSKHVGQNKTVLKVRFTALKAYISKDEKPHASNLKLSQQETNRIKRSPKEAEGRK